MTRRLSEEKRERLRWMLKDGVPPEKAASVIGVVVSTAYAERGRLRGAVAMTAAEYREINAIIDSCPPHAPHKAWFRGAPWKRRA